MLRTLALILAGGKGTRLRPLTVYTPKPIVPICNRPFLLYQIDTLKRAGITDITLSLSYQPHKIEQQLGDGSDYGVKIRYTVEYLGMRSGRDRGRRQEIPASHLRTGRWSRNFDGDPICKINVAANLARLQGTKALMKVHLTSEVDESRTQAQWLSQ